MLAGGGFRQGRADLSQSGACPTGANLPRSGIPWILKIVKVLKTFQILKTLKVLKIFKILKIFRTLKILKMFRTLTILTILKIVTIFEALHDLQHPFQSGVQPQLQNSAASGARAQYDVARPPFRTQISDRR